MVEESGSSSNRPIDRRSVLAAAAGVGLTGVGGCLGGGSGGSPTADTEGQPESTEATPTSAGTTADAEGTTSASEPGTTEGESDSGDCPSTPSSYERMPIPAPVNREEPIVSIEAPTSGAELNTGPSSLVATFGYEPINFSVSPYPDSSVESTFGISQNQEEVTDGYDFPEGARVVEWTDESTARLKLYLPWGSGCVWVDTAILSSQCVDALRPVQDHMFRSIRLV